MPKSPDIAIADGDVGLAAEERSQQLGHVLARVLVVGIGVHDEVGPTLEAGVDPRHECRREALVAREPNHVVDAARARHFLGAVPRAVIDDQRFDDVDAGDVPRKIAQRVRQHGSLVQARDLDNHLFTVRVSPPHRPT